MCSPRFGHKSDTDSSEKKDENILVKGNSTADRQCSTHHNSTASSCDESEKFQLAGTTTETSSTREPVTSSPKIVEGTAQAPPPPSLQPLAFPQAPRPTQSPQSPQSLQTAQLHSPRFGVVVNHSPRLDAPPMTASPQPARQQETLDHSQKVDALPMTASPQPAR